jgi:hypothetical protein
MLVELHARNYLERFGEPYSIVWGRDMKLASDTLKTHPFAKHAQWNREFIWSDDRQISEGGYSFPQYVYHLGKIITRSASSRTVKLLKGIYYDPAQTRTPIRDAVALLAVNFGKMDMEPPQTRSYERTLNELKDAPEILMKAVELLIDEHAAGRQFYPVPKPSDLKGACAKVIEVLRLREFVAAIELCDHEQKGWEELTREDGSTVLQRCSHWRMGKTRMEAIAKPLALPASSDRMEPLSQEIA